MATQISLSFLSYAFLVVSLFLLNKGYALGGGERETLESHSHTVETSSLLPASVCSHSTKGDRKRGSLKVVHKHGPCSDLGPDKYTTPTATQILTRDQSRVNSIKYRLGFNSGQNNLQDSLAKISAKSGRSIGSGNYIVTIGLGTPKKDLSLIFDTGSDLTWTQCQPCVKSCYDQQEPILDPALSSTYKNVSCKSVQCNKLSSATGNQPGCSIATCIYGIQYGDSSFSVGYFGTETLTLTPDIFPDFYFGCGQNNQGLFGKTAGLLGLGRDQLSVVSQTASKYGKYFSYCLPTPSSSSGYLNFGKGGSSALKFTPILTDSRGPSFYFIDVVAIKVGGQTLSISHSVFQTAGTIIDSGTVITRLPPAAYSALRAAFRQQMSKYPMAAALSILDTCYDLSKYDTVQVPTIRFLLAGNVEVPIIANGILYGGNPSQVCLAFAGNSDASDVGILGNVQQQTLEVVYDVAGGKLGFGTGGC
ncbi:aspartyl protease family protein At5g10770-like [Actinidia eriantha]|uniref:aspartyl protease family protein At5g10770-like n=1 Tax=Actinidia eriantha TaxID=165200 RepID=UPI00258F39F9|nr:aspartyl protease family protein At5g10770-like [Actinidia eriantha]